MSAGLGDDIPPCLHTAPGEKWYLCGSSGALGDEGPQFLVGFNGIGVEGVLLNTTLR